MSAPKKPCACGCGQRTTRHVRVIARSDIESAEALRWTGGAYGYVRMVAMVAGHWPEYDGYEDFDELRASAGGAA